LPRITARAGEWLRRPIGNKRSASTFVPWKNPTIISGRACWQMRREQTMANNEPKQARTRAWGVSMTIAAIVLGVYLVSLFYVSVTDQASRVGDDEQAQALNQR
jgi:hypothetical protein